MASNNPQWQALPCGGYVSTNFNFYSVQYQEAANTVYVNVSTQNGLLAASNTITPKVQQFKTDWERMQYIIGRQGTVPRCSGF